MFNVGVMYARGQGCDHSYGQALKWISKASDAGHKKAEGEVKKLRDLMEVCCQPKVNI